jgi:Sec-independent protein translocase protein TatA
VFAFLENLSLTEICIVIVVAVMVFGGKLPEAAGQAAAQLQKLRRTLTDLKRETGIDKELAEMKRNVEQAIPRLPRIVDVPGTIERRLEAVAREADAAATKPEATPDAAEARPANAEAAPQTDASPTPKVPAETPSPR